MKSEIIVDEDKEYLLKDHKWYKHNGYACAFINGSRIMLHHIIIGFPPIGLETDHINRNKLDNRVSNLRHVTHRDNLLNRDFTNKSGYRGVYFDSHSKRSKPYKAMVRRYNKGINIGYYSTAEEANYALLEYLATE